MGAKGACPVEAVVALSLPRAMLASAIHLLAAALRAASNWLLSSTSSLKGLLPQLLSSNSEFREERLFACQFCDRFGHHIVRKLRYTSTAYGGENYIRNCPE